MCCVKKGSTATKETKMKRTSAVHVMLKVAMPVDLTKLENLDAIGKAVIELRRAAEAAGGEVVAVSHRVGTHMFAPPAPRPNPDYERGFKAGRNMETIGEADANNEAFNHGWAEGAKEEHLAMQKEP